MRGRVRGFGVAGIPGRVGRDAPHASAAGSSGRPPRGGASTASRAFQTHVDSNPVNDRLLHVIRLPALAEPLIPRVHSRFQIEQTGHASLRFHNAIANLVGDLFAVGMRVVAEISHTREPAARNPPCAPVFGALTVGYPAGVFRQLLGPFVLWITWWIE